MKKKLLAYLLYYTGIFWLKLLWMKIFGSRKLRILCYHRVIDIDPDTFEFDEDLVDATVVDFDKQMRFVSRHFNVITFKDFIKYREKGKLPKNPLIITFDDGYKDNYTNAYPILKKYKLPATVFLATDYIGNNNLFWWDRVAYLIKHTSKKKISIDIDGQIYSFDISDKKKKKKAIVEINRLLKMIDNSLKNRILENLENNLNVVIDNSISRDICLSWEDIREMSKNGIDFEAHSCTHPILTNLPYKEMRKEILSSKKAIEAKLSRPVKFFAYPNGNFDNLCKESVKEAGFIGACSYEYGTNNFNHEKIYELKRISMHIDITPLIFMVNVVFPELMSGRRSSSIWGYDRSTWMLYQPSKRSLNLFLSFNKDFSKRLRLSYFMLKVPIIGLSLAKIICSKYIAVFKNNHTTVNTTFSESMIPIIKNYIVNNLEKIFPELVEISDHNLSFLIDEGKRGIRFYVMSDKRSLLFIKLIKHKRLEYMLKEEYRNIKYLHTKLDKNMKETIPELCLLEKVNGYHILILNYISGTRMSEIIDISRTERAYKLEKEIMKALKWLIEFQKQTEISRIKISSIKPKIETMLSWYLNLFSDSKDIETFFNHKIIDKIKDLEDFEISLVCSHGDFFPNNILFDKEKVSVVDWADMEKRELPTDDLFAFFLSFRISNSDIEDDVSLESFKFVFLEKNWFSTLTKKYFDWYCSETGLNRDIISLLFPVYLLKQALWEAEGVLRDKLISPQNWIGRLKYFVRNYKDFILI